ncbi:MAG TPA: polyribonucleotide nucleotidyltransferase [Planctomycetes bacterium]|nr:polyribonucleotide nucleotidyltransferase [Planctomycetota bacterium]
MHFVEREIAGRLLRIEAGKVGKQASGAVLVRYGDTVVFCAAVMGDPPPDKDFFPLTVDYREKTYAAGKIPGGFFKREGRPTAKEILTMRLIDRPVRPLFPDGFKHDISISCIVLSADKQNDPDLLAMIGSSAALTISEIPFLGPTGSVKFGMTKDGELKVNPTIAEVDEGLLDLAMSGTRDAITMLECGARELSEAQILAAMERGHEVIREIVAMQEDLQRLCGKPKFEVAPPESHNDLYRELAAKFGNELRGAIRTPGKLNRKKAEEAVVERVVAEYCPEGAAEQVHDPLVVAAIMEDLRKNLEREQIMTGVRADGRGYRDIRQITCEVGVLPRTHGSSLFTRGETQALVVVTLGTELDEQVIDGLNDEYTERLLVHYDFPAFSVGETWPNRGPKRREIGHGNLARRALEAIVPQDDSFPYTIRVNSDILESNGSSSMATVCGASLALMDAGVPLGRSVAGIAMGMVKDGDKIAVLSDIQGSEDHNGDLDFKVAGTDRGITAMQLDCKVKGISFAVLAEALEQARQGRLQVLDTMGAVLPQPRDHHSPFAPRVERFMINPEKIGLVIGPSGKTIRKIQEDTSTTIAVVDEGRVSIWGPSQESTLAARKIVEALVEEPEVGKIYTGKVTSIKDFGCFVEIIPGQEGLVHVSEMASGYVEHASDVVALGDEISVKCIAVGDDGKIKLSIKALNPEAQAEGQAGGPPRPPRRHDRGGRGGREGGGFRGHDRGGRPERRR